MKFKAITPVRLYENVIEQIMELIKRNELKPGDKLPPERELAEKFSISRGSLRESFRVLESKGLIKSKPGGGRFIQEVGKDHIVYTENMVLNLKKSSILEILEARDVIEQKVAEIAANRATAKDLKAIEETIEGLSKARNSQERIESDNNFHLAIVKSSYNFVFVDIMRLNLSLLNEIRGKNWAVPGRYKNTKEEHQLIYKAIKERNSKKAGEAMLNHLKNVRNSIINL